MNFKNDKEKVKHLNELYTDMFTEEQAVENFIYLTVKGRAGGRTTVNHIRNCHRNRSLGNLLKKYDPIAFRTA